MAGCDGVGESVAPEGAQDQPCLFRPLYQPVTFSAIFFMSSSIGIDLVPVSSLRDIKPRGRASSCACSWEPGVIAPIRQDVSDDPHFARINLGFSSRSTVSSGRRSGALGGLSKIASRRRTYRLTVYHRLKRPEGRHGLADARIAVGPVEAVASEKMQTGRPRLGQ
jgi:hypothetical protein